MGERDHMVPAAVWDIIGRVRNTDSFSERSAAMGRLEAIRDVCVEELKRSEPRKSPTRRPRTSSTRRES